MDAGRPTRAGDFVDDESPLPAPPPRSRRHRLPPEAGERLLRLARIARRPLERFLAIEAASGLLLLVAAAVALVWANSPWADSYARLWHTPVGLRLGGFTFERSFEWFVSDGLMVIFFFVVGLEVRREVHQGELSEWRRAALPAAAALGGMLAPAALYLVVAGSPETRPGWGVPMATDIAFAVGVLTLLGKRVPAALRVLLLALAVIDDLGAIVVIAAFYSSGVGVEGLVVAALALFTIVGMQRFGVRAKAAYVLPAVAAWAGVAAAGIHPTIAGVAVGLLTPVRAERESVSPAEGLIAALHPWVAFAILPLFAIANAGVHLSGGAMTETGWRIVTGVALGLVVGKPLGILAACWLTLKAGVATLPRGLGARQLVVLGMVAGVGFTMALFVAQLAFRDPARLDAAKLGILAASAVAAVVGLVGGRILLPAAVPADAAATADEAERSTEL
jgi:NhaA family Na+:H+ antiporter